MPSKQTRRSISISGELYEALKAKAEADGDSQSGLVEATMREALGMQPRSKRSPATKAEPCQETEVSETATAMRRQIARDAETRKELIKEAAKRKAEREAAKVDSQGGIFTF
jgi:hypothetical protein